MVTVYGITSNILALSSQWAPGREQTGLGRPEPAWWHIIPPGRPLRHYGLGPDEERLLPGTGPPVYDYRGRSSPRGISKHTFNYS